MHVLEFFLFLLIINKIHQNMQHANMHSLFFLLPRARARYYIYAPLELFMNIFEYFSYVLIISKIRAIIQLFKYSFSFFYSRGRWRVIIYILLLSPYFTAPALRHLTNQVSAVLPFIIISSALCISSSRVKVSGSMAKRASRSAW